MNGKTLTMCICTNANCPFIKDGKVHRASYVFKLNFTYVHRMGPIVHYSSSNQQINFSFLHQLFLIFSLLIMSSWLVMFSSKREISDFESSTLLDRISRPNTYYPGLNFTLEWSRTNECYQTSTSFDKELMRCIPYIKYHPNI